MTHNRCTLFGLVVLITLIGQAHSLLELWPLPFSVKNSTGVYTIDPNYFKFTSQQSNDILTQAFQRYTSLVFYEQQYSQSQSIGSTSINFAQPVTSLAVQLGSTSTSLTVDTDESYKLVVVSPQSTLTAATVFGALRGLETFSQLVTWTNSSSGSGYFIYGVPITIQDKPRFPHRGLLIDTARHYLPVDTILHAVDALSYSKMNVLHWHVTDAESFPMESTAFPMLIKGAWTPSMTYSADDVSMVVNYALYRGVRVIPEFDTPGHSFSWGIGYPSLTATCPAYSTNVNNVPLNPTLSFTYDVLSGLFGEMTKLFTDNYFHIGGDEVIYGCWQQDNNITQWMNANGIQSYNQLMQLYETKLWKILSNKNLIAWEEIFNAYGISSWPANMTIEVWKSEDVLLQVAQANLKGILAAGWYLSTPTLTWEDFYSNEPFQSQSWTPSLESLILGGEAAAWGETINAMNFDQIVWPRAAATAERLWSQQNVVAINAATPRLVEQVCRLNRRGVMASPFQPGYC